MKLKKWQFLYAGVVLVSIASIFIIFISHTKNDLISLFPLNQYDQTLSTWINLNDPNADKPLLSEDMQQKRMAIFYERYIGALSPWSVERISKILRQAPSAGLKAMEQELITYFSNSGKPDNQIGYGENFRPYDKTWIKNIANNINLSQFNVLGYHPNQRGMAIDNLHVRALPTEDVHFNSHKQAGQGYPFDNLQMSALWAGTPVYIAGETRDHAWMLVITPEYIGWVKSNGIARVDPEFVEAWRTAAKNKLAAITRTQTSLIDSKGTFLLSAYVGSVFPGIAKPGGIQLMIPVANADRYATIQYATVPTDQAALMPITATPRNFFMIMSTLIKRPYGWGNMYFYNDCSAELKSLLTPFGIWLPRHSSDQVTVGKMVDISADTPENRLSYLMKNGRPFLTLVYIGGHVVMYIGSYPNPHKENNMMVMTYQNVWGLRPSSGATRAIIGQAVLFPMLSQYPEDTNLVSFAAKTYFQVSYLDEMPTTTYLMKENNLLRAMMFPEALAN